MKIRDELEQMGLNDLLGPVGGSEEEISEPSVRDRYLVGMLAPNSRPRKFDELPQWQWLGGKTAPPTTREETRCQFIFFRHLGKKGLTPIFLFPKDAD
jgi:hypothetical protein